MKNSLSLLLIISFIGIAIFGFVLFDMGPNHSGGCIASVVTRSACPTSIADFATHHISALQTLVGRATPANSDWFLLITSLFIILASILLFCKKAASPKIEFLPQHLRSLSPQSFYNQQKIISWLSLLELSPAL